MSNRALNVLLAVIVIILAIAANWLLGVDKVDGDTGDPAGQNVVIYDDGSGVQYFGDTEVRTFPADTFAWDCAAMGNRQCGS